MAVFPTALNQFVARKLREEKGTELTPDQVDDLRVSAFAKIREHMRELGHAMPDDDMEMLAYMKRILSEPKGGV